MCTTGYRREILTAVLSLLLSSLVVRHADAVGTAFTYQGQLQLFGAPANGTCNMQFSLWDALSGPTQVGATLSHAVTVTNGVFSVPLDFGGGAFAGNDRWLEISVDCPGGGGFMTLQPRQPVTAAPYALLSNTVLDNAITGAKILDGTVATADLADGAVTGNKLALEAVHTPQISDGAIDSAKIASGSIVAANVDTNSLQRRVTGTCAGTNAMSAINADGSVVCVSGGVTFAGSGSATTASRSDHNHFNQSWGGSAPVGLEVTNSSTGVGIKGTTAGVDGVRGESTLTNGNGVHGIANTGTSAFGVYGQSDAGFGVRGTSTASSGVSGNSTTGIGVNGTSGGVDGVRGESTLTNGNGVHGIANSGTSAFGVYGQSDAGLGVRGNSTTGIGVEGKTDGSDGVRGESTSPGGYGVHGIANTGTSAYGVYGESDAGFGVFGNSKTGLGVYGRSDGSRSVGVQGNSFGENGTGVAGVADNGAVAIGVYGKSLSGYAGYFQGAVNVTGALTAGVKPFKIDHPLDPANKYLYHAAVESPDMKNIYDGIVVLDDTGEAVVELPLWFEALNRDFRYQLTCIGGVAAVYIAEEVSDHHFRIAGGNPGLKVSWQVTGIRKDAFANAHPLVVEQDKLASERGLYLYPTEAGMSASLSVEHAKDAPASAQEQ